MGLKGYFKAPRPKEKPPVAYHVSSEKAPAPSPGDGGLLQPAPAHTRRNSSAPSTRSTGSSVFFDEIKHEVMVNYLYQQQCSYLWVGELAGEAEGVLLRKQRGHYMACPPQLAASPLATSCAALNVQVRFPLLRCGTLREGRANPPVRHDGELPCHKDLPPVGP